MATFLDTNVVVYAHDHASEEKRQTATSLLIDTPDQLVVSTQVLSEFYWTVTRKLSPALPHGAAAEATRLLALLPVVTIDGELVLRAIDTAHRHQLALWDAMIVEAGVRGGCDRLLTEDLNHGQEIHGVLIENPFHSASGSS